MSKGPRSSPHLSHFDPHCRKNALNTTGCTVYDCRAHLLGGVP